MLRLSKMNDYAVVVLGQMAGRPGTVVTAPDVAEATGLPASTVSQVLKRLAHGQLVASHRGAHGGYSLARSAAEISVADLVEALEGPVARTACFDGAEGHCGVESVCPLRGGWDRVNTAIRAALASVTLAALLTTPPRNTSPGPRVPPGTRLKPA